MLVLHKKHKLPILRPFSGVKIKKKHWMLEQYHKKTSNGSNDPREYSNGHIIAIIM